MKSPLLSLNLRKNSIIFNQAFIKFIKEYFDQKEFFTDFLFDEGDQIDDLSANYNELKTNQTSLKEDVSNLKISIQDFTNLKEDVSNIK